MAATEHGHRHERRRFVTRHDVEDAAASGQPIRLRGRDLLTDEAAQRAMDLGVIVERDSDAGPGIPRGARTAPVGPATGSSAGSGSSVRASASQDDLRRAVRAAVVAELGSEPPGLDAAIDRVLRRRSH